MALRGPFGTSVVQASHLMRCDDNRGEPGCRYGVNRPRF